MGRMIKCFRNGCETIFESINGSKYCCDDCRRVAKNEKNQSSRIKRGIKKRGPKKGTKKKATRDFGTSECPVCGMQFQKRTYNHTYCCRRCRLVSQWAIEAEREEKRMEEHFDYQPGDFSQAQYEKEQAALMNLNGRRCQWWNNFGYGLGNEECSPSFPAFLVGNERFYCKEHQKSVNSISVTHRCDDNWGNEAVIDWGIF